MKNNLINSSILSEEFDDLMFDSVDEEIFEYQHAIATQKLQYVTALRYDLSKTAKEAAAEDEFNAALDAIEEYDENWFCKSKFGDIYEPDSNDYDAMLEVAMTVYKIAIEELTKLKDQHGNNPI